MSNKIINWYIENRAIYKRLSSKVESLLLEVFEMNKISFHIVSSRTKDIESLREKVHKNDKYKEINQIQDYAGIRIITYVEDEIDEICKIIEDIFDIDKENSSDKSDNLGVDKVGYKSVHYIASLKSDRLSLPEYKQFENKCFEIQIRTILQHAWAEIEHDRNYKFSGKLPKELNRRFKILAGSLELIDREFNSISNEIDLISQKVKESTKKGELDISISSTTLNQYLKTRFENFLNKKDTFVNDEIGNAVTELKGFGINTLSELDKLIPNDFEEFLDLVIDDKIYEIAMIRDILMLDDYDKYFLQFDEMPFQALGPEYEKNHKEINKYYKKHNSNFDAMISKYKLELF